MLLETGGRVLAANQAARELLNLPEGSALALTDLLEGSGALDQRLDRATSRPNGCPAGARCCACGMPRPRPSCR